MLLAFNVGNESIALGAWAGDTLRFTAELSARPPKTADEYAVLLSQIFVLRGLAQTEIDEVIIASVVPALLDTVRRAVAHFTAVRPLIVGPGMKTGLKIRIDAPAQLGADLVAMAAGAKRYTGGGAVIACLETATTLTVLDGGGALCGVVILPGIGSCAAALERDAAQLPQITLTPPRRVIGRNTADSICSGLLWGAAAQLDGLTTRIAEELSLPVDEVTLLATGSFAPKVLPLCQLPFRSCPKLLFEGLHDLCRAHRSASSLAQMPSGV